jgi:hypothetical protein
MGVITFSVKGGTCARQGRDPDLETKAPAAVAAGAGEFLAKAELLDQLPVPLAVLSLQVVQQLAALADQLEQPAAGMMILDVRLEVIGQSVDAGGDQSHLDFRRTGVACGALMLLHDLRFLRNGHGHASLLSLVSSRKPGILS